jgi:hypothetical protein
MSLSGIFRVVFFAALAALILVSGWGSRQKAERERLAGNQEAFMRREAEYKLRDSLNAVSIGALTLKANEFGRHFEEMNALIRDMGVKIRRVESLAQSATRSDYEISAPVRDTVFVIDTTKVTHGLSLVYEDPWIRLDGIIAEEVFRGTVATFDTLTQVVHRVPKKFLFLRFGTKELRQEIVSSNPHTTLTYSRHIRIEK